MTDLPTILKPGVLLTTAELQAAFHGHGIGGILKISVRFALVEGGADITMDPLARALALPVAKLPVVSL